MAVSIVLLSVDVTGAGIYKSVRDSFQSEEVDLFSYFRNNLVGYASDDEASMSGQYNGLIAHIRKDTKKYIFATHCMAHRLELAIKHAFAKHEYFTRFENTINELFKFNNNNALKRKSHLRKTASDLKENIYELNYVYHTRWISSEYQSVSNLKKMWKVLVTSLSRIADENEFDLDVKDTARNLKSKLLSNTFSLSSISSFELLVAEDATRSQLSWLILENRLLNHFKI